MCGEAECVERLTNSYIHVANISQSYAECEMLKSSDWLVLATRI